MRRLSFLIISFTLLTALNAFAFEEAVETTYQEAATCYHSVKGLAPAKQSRAKWHKCAKAFEDFSRNYSKSDRGPDALFSAGLVYRNIYRLSDNVEDAKAATKKFNEVVRMYGKSSLADDALYNVGKLRNEVLGDPEGAKSALLNVVRWYPEGDKVAAAKDYLSQMDGGTEAVEAVRKPTKLAKYATLKKIDRSKGGDGGSVTLHLSGPISFEESHGTHNLNNFDLYSIELENTYLSRLLDSGYSFIGKGVIRDIVTKQISRDKALVSIVVREGNQCRAALKGNDIGIHCEKDAKPDVAPMQSPSPIITADPVPRIGPPPVLNGGQVASRGEMASPGRRLSVVIDPGHGGDDTGAIGPGGTMEKDVVLQMSKRLGWQLRNKYGIDVNYTRIDDRAISLDDRNRIAKGFNADLFISIHTNAAESEKLDGYQTFYLNNATDKASRRLAARENESLGKNMDDLERIILTMMQNVNTDESRFLSKSIHKNVLSNMSRYGLKDRKIKSALFYVLVGAQCPAVLIETSFISNPAEEKRLKTPEYQEEMVRAIATGISDYLAKSKMARNNL